MLGPRPSWARARRPIRAPSGPDAGAAQSLERRAQAGGGRGAGGERGAAGLNGLLAPGELGAAAAPVIEVDPAALDRRAGVGGQERAAPAERVGPDVDELAVPDQGGVDGDHVPPRRAAADGQAAAGGGAGAVDAAPRRPVRRRHVADRRSAPGRRAGCRRAAPAPGVRETPVPATPPSVPGPMKAPGSPSPAHRWATVPASRTSTSATRASSASTGRRGQPRPPAGPHGARARRPAAPPWHRPCRS